MSSFKMQKLSRQANMEAKMSGIFMVILLGMMAGVARVDAANYTFQTLHIVTICDVYRINWTKNNQTLPRCDELPYISSAEDFFRLDSDQQTLWEAPCEDTSHDEPVARKPTIWDRGIRALHWFIGEVQNKIAAFGWFIKAAVDDVTRFSLISKQWDFFWYITGGIGLSLLFFLQGLYISRPGKMSYNIILNVAMGFAAAAAYYMAHLYFRADINFMITFVVIGLFVLTPFFAQMKLTAFGILTGIELVIPLIGFVVLNVFNTALFFGPTLSLYINCGGIAIHILCLVALYVDEKLILVKVFLLPFVRMFQKVFGLGKKNEREMARMRQEAQNLTIEIFNTFEHPPPEEMSSTEALDRALTSALRSACEKRTAKWEDECWYFIKNQCKDATWNAGAGPYIIGWVACPKMADKACPGHGQVPSINLTAYCDSSDSVMGAAYNGMMKYINQLAREIVIDPLKPKVNSEILERTAGFDLFTAKWTWWLRHIISWSFAGLALALLFSSMFYAIIFLVKYRRNDYFCNNYLSPTFIEHWRIKLSRREKLKYYFNFTHCVYDYLTILIKYPGRFVESLSLLSKVSLCFFVEQTAKFLHNELNKIQFVVPQYGDARFVFNVQGHGFFASILRAVLGGFSLQSKYCKVTDASVCETAFVPVTWQMWLMLFGLAIFYFAIGLYQSRSDYLMCRLCDFLIREQGERRAQVVLEDCLAEREKRAIITRALAKEEVDPAARCSIREQNDLVLLFYNPRSWYHRFMPTIVLSIWAYIRFGVDNIMCQVCFQEIISGRFRCKSILFCEECRIYLKKCPCGSDVCRDGIKFDV